MRQSRVFRTAGAGDARAAEALVRRHLPRMIGLARRMLNDAAEAEDVAQDLFLRVWREAPRWRPGAAKFETWMHRVALNLCYDRLRRRREKADPDAGLYVADTAPLASEAWLARQRSVKVHEALAQLPEEQRRAVVLATIGGRTSAEIGRIEGVPIPTAKSRLRTGLRRLRELTANEVRP